MVANFYRAFYVWLSRPPKTPPAVKGRMLAQYDQFLALCAQGGDM